MGILVVDSVPAAANALAKSFQETLGYDSFCCCSVADAVEHFKTGRDSIWLIVYFLDTGAESCLFMARLIRAHCEIADVRSPCFLALAPGKIPPGDESKLRLLDIEWQFYGFEMEVHSAIRRTRLDIEQQGAN